MIRCAVCRGRIRPPKRAWTTDERGRVSFYKAANMKQYARFIADFAKNIPFVHEICAETAEPNTLPRPHIIALNLDVRLRMQQAEGR